MKKFEAIATYTDSYQNITLGKVYTIEVLNELRMKSGFTFPAYANFIDDFGRKASSHLYRFKHKDGSDIKYSLEHETQD